MPYPVRTQTESERILSWYALVERVYELADAVPPACAHDVQSDMWRSVLHEAAAYFGVHELKLCEGRAPAARPRGPLLFPLPALRCVADALLNEAAVRPTEVPLFETKEFYLLARPGRPVSCPSKLPFEIQRFARHVARCMRIQHGLEADYRSLRALYDTLDAQDLAVVLCDAQCRPRFFNRPARALRKRHPDLRFDSEEADLRFKRHPVSQLFEHFRQNVRIAKGGAIRLSSGALHWTLVPLLFHDTRAAFASDGPSLALIVQEQAFRTSQSGENVLPVVPEVPDALRLRLRDRFALTEAEARLGYGLYSGLSVAAYAALAKRSPLTIRKQLKSIYSKLCVHDQKALILCIWQEQRVGWSRCVALLATPGASGAAPCVLYPQVSRSHGTEMASDRMSAASEEGLLLQGDDRGHG